MSLPKEPRQKMINIMYLVLTALLALNVSSEILNAFRTVDISLGNANKIIEDKNQQLLTSLNQLENDAKTHDKAVIWRKKALDAQQIAEDANTYINNLKQELLVEAKLDPATGEYREDDLEAATRLFVSAPPTGKGKGEELKNRLADVKTKLLALDPDIEKEFASTLPIDLEIPKSKNAASKKDWPTAYFHMTPTIAAITILSKFQNDIKNSEAQVIEFCHKQVGEVKVVFDQFQPIVSQSSQYLMPGQELTISGGVSASNKAVVPTVTVDGSVIPLNSEGVAETKFTVGAPGSYTKKVTISFKKPDGTDGSVQKDVQYTVGSPTGVSVSADAVKVLYVGLDNPISISGGAKGAEAITATIDNGSIKNMGNGKFIADVETPGAANISVTVDGKTASYPFRVKNVPPPTPMVGNSGGGAVSAAQFKAQAGLRADLKDFVFENVKYTVSSFYIIFSGKGFEASPKVIKNSGARFTAEVEESMEKCKAGSVVSFMEIYVEGPGGSRKLDATATFTLGQ
jgi:gliding motility-associated protein GldM